MRVDKKRDLVYMYLEQITENLEVIEDDYGNLKGVVNGYVLFRYYRKNNIFSFYSDEIHFISTMFDLTFDGVKSYLKSFFVKKLKNPNIATSTFLII